MRPGGEPREEPGGDPGICSYAKGTQGAAESSVWLPALSQSSTIRLSRNVLPKTKAIPLAGGAAKRKGSLEKALFTVDTFPDSKIFVLPGIHEKRQCIGKLSGIEGQEPEMGLVNFGMPVAARQPSAGEGLPRLVGRGASEDSSVPGADLDMDPETLYASARVAAADLLLEDEDAASSSPSAGFQLYEDDYQPQRGNFTTAAVVNSAPSTGPLLVEGTDSMPASIKTDDDVIAFYAKYGQDSPVKFFYCNRCGQGVEFRPYDLDVVPRNLIGAEYFTMSATGVMKITRGKRSEFITLAAWLREKTMFSLLRNLRFFRHYLHGRAFRRWHKYVRQKMLMRMKRKLEGKLFFAKPSFCPSLMQIGGLVAEVASIRVAGANPNHLHTLEEYADAQVKIREMGAKPALEHKVEAIQAVVERLCQEAHRQAKLYQESIRDEKELLDTTGVELLQGGVAGMGRAMVSIKQEKINRAQTYYRVMEELSLLGNFIRLVDYMFLEAVMSLSVCAVEDLLGLLTLGRDPDQSSRGIFNTVLSFQEDGMCFTPDLGAVQDVLNNNVIEGVLDVAKSVPRILFMRAFSHYFDGRPSGLNPMNIIRSMPRFVEIRQLVDQTIAEDFEAAKEAVQYFEKQYRSIWTASMSWTEEAYRAESTLTLRTFRADLHKQKKRKNDLDKMKLGHIFGCLFVDSKPLKAQLVPLSNSVTDGIKEVLMQVARDRCLTSLEELHSRIAFLENHPRDLHNFMSYMVGHKEQVEEKRNLKKQTDEVEEMYELLHIYDQKVPTSDLVKFDDMRAEVSRFQEELVQGKEFLQECKQQQLNDLAAGVTELNEKCSAKLQALKEGIFVDPSYREGAAEVDADGEDDTEPSEVADQLQGIIEELTQLEELSVMYRQYQELNHVAPDEFNELLMAQKEARNRLEVWQALAEFVDLSRDWTFGPLLDEQGQPRLDIKIIRDNVDRISQQAHIMGRANKEDKVVQALKDGIEEFKEAMPLMEELCTPALKTRHWVEIFKIVGADSEYQQRADGSFIEFAIADMLKYPVMDNLEKLQLVSSSASKEWSLEQTLAKMKKDWEGVEFRVVDYKDTGTYIIGGTDDIQAILDDQLMKVQAMRSSPFIAPIEEEATQWDTTLNTLQDMLDQWLVCQATWQYLEPIFSSPDIMKQMPEEGEKFQQVDQVWREVMELTHTEPACVEVAQDKARLANLATNNQLLDEIQKGLAAYLEVKRIAFPRFFFLSNDEMLEILSETKDPTRVQPHLKKCFEGIRFLKFLPNTDITGMISEEGELVPLKTVVKPSKANGAVEQWLVQVEQAMLESLHDVCAKGVDSFPTKPRDEWVLEWPGQVVLVVTAIYWTSDVARAIASCKAGALQQVADVSTSNLDAIVGRVRGKLTKLERATLSALVVMDVHSRDVVAQLAKEGIEGEEQSFSWLSQLRMYWESTNPEDPEYKTIPIRMMNAEAVYGYEYLGNSGRLVVTPLTDRCYRTLIGAIHMNLGGAPEGPAGTGKTETTKDLAKALARQCVVFNCSDTLDYITMAKFFKGLAASGAWACFDEFNRINLEVLSVVAQQVLEIQLALKSKLTRFFFEGSELPLRHTCNAFITMNPGYAGRSELPDNLKALFRTVAMMVPDYALIAEIILYSNGYLKARDCARKIVATYRLCSEQLSSQDHYDYGMRAVMAVLRAAGNLKRQFPEEEEFVLMLRSIIDVNLCKFLSYDVPLFKSIVSDLFPGVVLPEPDYKHLIDAMKKQCKSHNLQPTEYFLMKTIQLYEMIVVRHGLMTVGQPFSGKTSSLKVHNIPHLSTHIPITPLTTFKAAKREQVLAGALSDLGARGIEGPLFTKVQMRVLNPKAVTMGQLYGENDKATQEWKDGVLAVAFRQLASDPSEDRKWCVLDGPVDAIWIENMNTVLDDNKKLCLPNSEIIQMSGTMSMIFEVGDLAVASPATVSRCGMVYLEPHQLGWKPLLTSWMQQLSPDLGTKIIKHIEALFNWVIPACLRFVRRDVKEISPTEDNTLVVGAMRLMESLMDEFRRAPAEPGEEAKPSAGAYLDEQTKIMRVEAYFMLAIVWSCGCTGDQPDRVKFDRFYRLILAGGVPHGYEDFIPQDRPRLTAPMMNDEDGTSVFDVVFDKETITWKNWSKIMGSLDIPADAEFADIIVPTIDSARYTFLLDKALQNNQPILFVGPTGTGKSVYVMRHMMSGLNPDSWIRIFITFSARTTANMTQEQVDGRLDKRKKGLYGPPIGKKALIFVDDLNMPAKEQFGAQPPIELLRQFMDYAGWYGRDNAFRAMQDVQFVCAMGTPGGGRTFVTNRYLRHFNTLALSQVASSTLVHIFRTILDWHMVTSQFPPSVKLMSDSLITATLEIYQEAIAKLLPTPTKSHYVFNLRDFARVIQGVMMMPSAVLPGGDEASTNLMKRLWVHEIFRVFCDRLVEMKDAVWLIKQVKATALKHLAAHVDTLMAELAGESADNAREITCEDMRRCFFGSYMDKEAEDPKNRSYAEVKDISQLVVVMEEYLADYNGMSKRPMNLAMFLFAVEHVSRICRVLSQPGGNMLLVGLGGSGRQSLTRLAACICEMETFQVEISKSYGQNEWREDLRLVLRQAGGEGKDTVFLFSDTQIKDEAFVEDINNILNSGEVPNLFPTDEKMQVLEMVRAAAGKKGLENPTELWGFFVQQCRIKLHMVLAMSPIGDAFRERLRQNPSIVNCCTIDWFQKWPADALEAVAFKFLKEIELGDELRTSMVALCQSFHETVISSSDKFLEDLGRHNYVTPTSYLELISLFKGLLGRSRANNRKLHSRYTVGLEKIESSAAQVAGMQSELEALQPQLVKTVGEVETLMAKIAKEKAEVVEPKAAIVAEEEAKAQEKANEAKAIKDECEGDLAEAIPILNEALAALDTIKEADINYIKKLGNPPAAIKLVLEVVCVVLEVKPAKAKDESGKTVNDFWKPSVALLNDKDFLNRLKTYDKDNIPPRIMSVVRDTYLTNPGFTPENAKKASPAAEGMCKWVYAMSSYDKVAKVVEPKKAKLAEAEGAYQEVMKGLRAKQDELKKLMDKLAAMESELDTNTAKKERLEHEVAMCTVKLDRAEKLIGGLGGEKARWTETAQNLDKAFTNLTGDLAISAAIVAYLGAFTSTFRDGIVEKFVNDCKSRKIPHSAHFSINTVLGEPVRIREWLIAGLPNDAFSITNGIMVANARRWPLMIDPQGQANKWVKNMEKSNNLQVIKLSSDGSYLRTLENSIQFGFPVLLENVGEELDPSLEPLLLKQVFKSGGVNMIKLGDTTIEYSNDFRFYITTKMRNPHYLPETAVKVTLLNFMITPAGLADQMLGVVVAQERPDLEQQRNELVVQSAENNRRLKEIEDKILEVLSSSTGNILEDETAIQIITEAKTLGNEIAEKQQLALVTEKEIEVARALYKPCGEYTSILFFAISDLAHIDPMYQYSLPWFVNLFINAVASAEKAEDVPTRLTHIHDYFTYSLFCNVCRSLFEKDKLLFSFLLCCRIMASQGKVDDADWMFLLTGGLGDTGARANPAPEWLADRSWKEICKMATLPAFVGIDDLVAAAPDEWEPLHSSPRPQDVPLPGVFNQLDDFRKLMVLRCFRPGKVVPAAQEFVVKNLGQRFAEAPPFKLADCFADSAPVTPLIFVLSPGTDPMAALIQFATEKQMDGNLQAISLGQGQGPKAGKLIAEGVKNGNWVVLQDRPDRQLQNARAVQNCHLAPSWMPALDKICEDLEPDTINPDFRLWMTAQPTPAFPVNILQNGVKMTNEPPKGLRANMKRSLHLDPVADESFFEGCNKPSDFKRLLFGLIYFHAVVQERRKFGPLGWNIPYGFDDGDWRISVRQLKMYLDENPKVPFDALRYITGECNYGGRVTDDKDRILLNTLLKNSYCEGILSGDYGLSASGTYHVDFDGELAWAEMVERVEKLPITTLPEAFGLHENADITKDQNETYTMFQSLLSMGGGGSGSGASAAAAERAVALVVKDCMQRLPALFDIEAARAKYPVLYEESMNTVLVQEMVRFNRLLAVMHDSLKNIDLALQGLLVMSAELEDAFRCIKINSIPTLWKKVSYPSLKPLGSYMEDLYRRLRMLQDWYSQGIPTVHWVSGFFFVQSFLTAGLQNYARRQKIPIDMVGYDFKMQTLDPESNPPPPPEGVYLHGLFLEGCGWDTVNMKLCESQPKVLYVPTPVMWLQPKKTQDFDDFPHYNCPVYRTAERKGVLATTGHSTNFIMFVRMPTDLSPDHWVKRGVAMLSQLSD